MPAVFLAPTALAGLNGSLPLVALDLNSALADTMAEMAWPRVKYFDVPASKSASGFELKAKMYLPGKVDEEKDVSKFPLVLHV